MAAYQGTARLAARRSSRAHPSPVDCKLHKRFLREATDTRPAQQTGTTPTRAAYSPSPEAFHATHRDTRLTLLQNPSSSLAPLPVPVRQNQESQSLISIFYFFLFIEKSGESNNQFLTPLIVSLHLFRNTSATFSSPIPSFGCCIARPADKNQHRIPQLKTSFGIERNKARNG